MSVASPCIGLCKMRTDADLCQGCYRTLAEITQWRDLPPAEQAHILTQLPARGLAVARVATRIANNAVAAD